MTPLQLITMASTIANGGMYLPPRILLESTEQMKGGGKLQPATFRPGHDLPNPLPDGSHRVISTLTSAQMRKMMEGVVLFGTGKAAQLNGYSAAGKTGTAEKIDPRTHTYSKTKYVASFVGFAPVNDPAITVVVVMDSPQSSMHYGASASAPLFHDLAQQILEYLGVSHDEEVKSTTQIAATQKDEPEEEPAPHVDDLDSLFAEVNNLPPDDPLRAIQPAQGHTPAPVTKDDLNTGNAPKADATARAPQTATLEDSQPQPQPAEKAPAPQPINPSGDKDQAKPASAGSVVVASGARVVVPSFLGQPVRKVIEEAGGVGLGVKVLGSGIARGQAPPAGTMVPAGTEIVVRFAH